MDLLDDVRNTDVIERVMAVSSARDQQQSLFPKKISRNNIIPFSKTIKPKVNKSSGAQDICLNSLLFSVCVILSRFLPSAFHAPDSR